MENKKNLITLLITLGIVLIGSSLYLFYFSREDVAVNWFDFFRGETMPASEMQQIEAAKSLTTENVRSFIKGNKLDDLVNDPQYQGLIDPNIIINIGIVSNPTPFTKPVQELKEEKKNN